MKINTQGKNNIQEYNCIVGALSVVHDSLAHRPRPGFFERSLTQFVITEVTQGISDRGRRDRRQRTHNASLHQLMRILLQPASLQMLLPILCRGRYRVLIYFVPTSTQMCC